MLSLWREILKQPSLTLTEPLRARSHQWLAFFNRSRQQGIYFESGISARCPNVLGLVRHLQQVQRKAIHLEYLQKQTRPGKTWEELLNRSQQRPGHEHARGDLLVNGATGQIGRWLLRILLEETRETIHCLVRAPSTRVGLERLIQLQTELGPFRAEWEKRLVVWCGHLEAEKWGLTDAAWKRLALGVSRIFHLAGHPYSDESLEQCVKVNLGGLQTAVKLQADGRPKALHYLSSLAIFATHDRPDHLILEQAELRSTGALYGGGSQSKWMTEAWLQQTGARAGSLHIYRPGLISGDTQQGYFSERDGLCRMTRALVQLRCLPEDINPDQFLQITPADYVARAIFTLATQTEKQRGRHVWHLVNPHRLRFSSWLEALNSEQIRIAYLPRAEWVLSFQTALQQASRAPDSVADLLALCRVLREDQENPVPGLDRFQSPGIHYDSRAADAILHREGIFCPSLTPDLLKLYLDHMLAGC